MNQSVVILGRDGSPYTNWVIQEALRANLPVTGILLQVWGRSQKWSRLKYYARNHGWLATVGAKFIEQADHMLLARYAERELPDVRTYYGRCRTHEVPTLNGKMTQNILDELKPSVLVLAGVGIIREAIISRAQTAVINAHPGLVPRYKGNYVVRWAILNGDEVGITVHVVDAGIDTGAVLSQRTITLPFSTSLMAVEHTVEQLRAKELVATTKCYLEGKITPQPQPLHEKYPSYSLMPPGKLLRTYMALRKRKANSS